MPRRLRVAFVPSQNITLPCAAGSFARTGKAAAFIYVSNAVIADTWTKISGPYTTGNTRAGPNINQGWTKAAMDTNTGKVFLSQGQPSPTAANQGNFFFNPSLGYWERTNTVVGDWHRNQGVITENYDITYNPDWNTFHRSYGWPIGGYPAWDVYAAIPNTVANPNNGDSVYNVATDEWSTPYPNSDCTYVPLARDAGYFGTPGNCMVGFDSAYKYYNGSIYQFGGFSIGPAQNLKKRDLTTGVVTNLISYPNTPPSTSKARTPHLVSGLDSRTKKIYTVADGPSYWECDLRESTLVWREITTTGDVPSSPGTAFLLSQGYTGNDLGFLSIIDEAANCWVVWVSRGATVQSDGGYEVRTTWIMDLATRVWRKGPNLAAGHTVPTSQVSVMQSLLYDPVGRRTLLTVGKDFMTEVWALNIAPIGGKITSWPLPTSTGSTYGVNYYGFPYTTNGESKHTNMAYCPANDRLYVSGGDTITSATDGTWSMSMQDGSWRLDFGRPNYPDSPAPYALQDGAGFEWVASRNKFLFWPGSYFPYPQPVNTTLYPNQNYAHGHWWFDPLTNIWEQDETFWTTFSQGTGCEYGGVYDEVNDHIVAFTDDGSGSGKTCRRWDLTNMVVMPSLPLTGFVTGSGVGAYFATSKPVKIGRYVYVLGYRTNGLTSSKAPLMFRWDLDAHVAVELAAPPVNGPDVALIEIRPAASNGKLVFPFTTGPDGTIRGFYVYNPANNTWFTETKRPAYGNYIGNAICSLPDGRVAFAGSTPSGAMTHIWFYEAT